MLKKDILFFNKNKKIYKIIAFELVGDRKMVADNLTVFLQKIEEDFLNMRKNFSEKQFNEILKNGNYDFFYQYAPKNPQHFLKQDGKLKSVDVETFYEKLLEGF